MNQFFSAYNTLRMFYLTFLCFFFKIYNDFETMVNQAQKGQ